MSPESETGVVVYDPMVWEKTTEQWDMSRIRRIAVVGEAKSGIIDSALYG